MLFPTVVHIAVRRELGIRTVRDLSGHRVFVGEAGSPTEGATRAVLQSHGLTFDDIRPLFDRNGVVEEFRASLDAIVFFYPIEHTDAVAMMRGGDAQLVPLDPRIMEAIRSRNPLLKPASIPGGASEGQAEPMLTVGTDVLLVSREDLSEDLVYTLTRTLFESVGQLRRAHRSAAFIDPGRGPGAPLPASRRRWVLPRTRDLSGDRDGHVPDPSWMVAPVAPHVRSSRRSAADAAAARHVPGDRAAAGDGPAVWVQGTAPPWSGSAPAPNRRAAAATGLRAVRRGAGARHEGRAHDDDRPLQHEDAAGGRVSRYDLADRFAGAFARFPYLESFFAWRRTGWPETTTYFFHRAEQPPLWDPSRPTATCTRC